MRQLVLGFLFLMMLPLHKGFAQNENHYTQLKNSSNDISLNEEDILVLRDSTSTFSIEQVSGNLNNSFVHLKKAELYNQDPSSTYWLKLNFKKSSDDATNYLLEFWTWQADSIDYYYQTENGKWKSEKVGTKRSFSNRPLENKNLIFEIPFADKSTTTCYVRIHSSVYAAFDMHVKKAGFFIHYITNEYMILGLYYGIIILLAFYNFLLFLSVREKIYLFYVFYLLSCSIITLCDDGIGYQYLWNQWPEMNKMLGYYVGPILLLFSFLVYSYTFLDLNKYNNKYIALIKYCTIAYVIYFFVMIIFPQTAIHTAYLIPYILVYILAWYLYYRGIKTVRLFIVGNTFICLGLLFLQLRAGHFITNGTIWAVYFLNFSIIAEGITFSYAMYDKIKMIRQEKDEVKEKFLNKLQENKLLQEKVNRELEEKIRQRTKELDSKNEELTSANLKLKDLNEEIQKMNSKLDHDNYYLKKEIKFEYQQRLTGEELTYEQFKEIFPSEFLCLKFLSELKWKDDQYICKKCHENKFSLQSDKLTKRCTKCGFIESPSAFTLLHGLRIPIDQALYITYYFFKEGADASVTPLHNQFEISKTSLIAFRNKIQKRIDDLKNENGTYKQITWHEIILGQ